MSERKLQMIVFKAIVSKPGLVQVFRGLAIDYCKVIPSQFSL